MSQQSQIVTFHMTCPEPQAWLVLASDNDKPRVLEMHQLYPCNWLAIAHLVPGRYRCRYYAGDDRTVVYYGAASIEGSSDSGMDALVIVKRPEQDTVPRFSRSETKREKGDLRLSKPVNGIPLLFVTARSTSLPSQSHL